MAIGSPYVGQGPKKESPLDYMGIGLQVGAGLQQLSTQMETTRANDAKMMESAIAALAKEHPGGMIGVAREQPDLIKNYIGKVNNLDPLSSQVDMMYSNWASSLMNPQQIEATATSEGLLHDWQTGGTQQPPQEPITKSTVQLPPMPPAISPEAPKDVMGPQQRLVTGNRGGTRTFNDFLKATSGTFNPDDAGQLQRAKEFYEVYSKPNGPEFDAYVKWVNTGVYQPGSGPADLAQSGINTAPPATQRGRTAQDLFVERQRMTGAPSSGFPSATPLPTEDRSIKPVVIASPKTQANLGNVNNGVFTANEGIQFSDREALRSGIAKAVYGDDYQRRGINEANVDNLMWVSAKDKLIQDEWNTGNYDTMEEATEAAEKAFFVGSVNPTTGQRMTSWMRPGFSAEIKRPEQMTFVDVMEVAGSTQPALDRAAQLEGQLKVVNEAMNVQPPAPTGTPGPGGYTTYAQTYQNPETTALYKKTMGYVARYIDGNEERYNTWIANNARMEQLLGGRQQMIQDALARTQQNDPYMAQKALELEERRVAVEEARTGIADRAQRLDEDRLAASMRGTPGVIALEKQQNELSKMVRDRHQDVYNLTQDLIKTNPNARNWGLAEIVANDNKGNFMRTWNQYLYAVGAASNLTPTQIDAWIADKNHWAIIKKAEEGLPVFGWGKAEAIRIPILPGMTDADLGVIFTLPEQPKQTSPNVTQTLLQGAGAPDIKSSQVEMDILNDFGGR